MALLFSENKKFYITKQGKFAFFYHINVAIISLVL